MKPPGHRGFLYIYIYIHIYIYIFNHRTTMTLRCPDWLTWLTWLFKWMIRPKSLAILNIHKKEILMVKNYLTQHHFEHASMIFFNFTTFTCGSHCIEGMQEEAHAHYYSKDYSLWGLFRVFCILQLNYFLLYCKNLKCILNSNILQILSQIRVIKTVHPQFIIVKSNLKLWNTTTIY